VAWLAYPRQDHLGLPGQQRRLVSPACPGDRQLGGVLPGVRTCHLDAGYDSGPTRQTLHEQGFAAQIAPKGTPAPIHAGRRWPVERTHSWMNGYGKLRRMTDRDATIVRFYLYLA
jgi:hypothetical protein